jgi:hypothetical protein
MSQRARRDVARRAFGAAQDHSGGMASRRGSIVVPHTSANPGHGARHRVVAFSAVLAMAARPRAVCKPSLSYADRQRGRAVEQPSFSSWCVCPPVRVGPMHFSGLRFFWATPGTQATQTALILLGMPAPPASNTCG